MKRCLHQVIRPKNKNNCRPLGVGECISCEHDEEENKKCKKYTPVNFTIIDVEERPPNI